MAHSSSAAAAAATALLAAVLLAAAPPPAAAQTAMITPLQGSGSPGPNTTEVFLSVYLDRLLAGEEGDGAWTVGKGRGDGPTPPAHTCTACRKPAGGRRRRRLLVQPLAGG